MLFDARVQDFRYALRAMRRAPTFAITTIVTLALGIGALTAIFSVLNAVVLRPLPFRDVARVLALGSSNSGFGASQTGQIFHYVRERAPSFERLAAYRPGNGWNLVAGERAEYVRGLAVSAGYFDVLGTPPVAGRAFSDAEDQANGPRAVVLSDAIWLRYFDRRADVVGQPIRLGGRIHTVVGIMPATFRSIPAADVWTPLGLSPQDNSLNYTVIGRLNDAATEGRAVAELRALKPEMLRDLRDAGRSFPRRIEGLTWLPYQQVVASNSRGMLTLLLGAAGFVLLIACANVAGLQIVRGLARRREMATRAALGGGRPRAIALILTESLLLGLAGAVAGLVVARAFLALVLPLLDETFLLGQAVALDWRVLGTAVGAAMATSVVFGLWPAADAARLDIRTALWSSGERSTGSLTTRWLRRSFVLAEVAVACVLLVGAGLFVRTILTATRVELGFDPARVLTAQMSMQGTEGGATPWAAVYERALDRIRQVPGVVAAAVGNNVPVERGLNLAVEPTGQVSTIRAMDWRYITADYFTVFRIPVIAGRAFGPGDGASDAPVIIVNEAFARAYFGSATAALDQTVTLARQLSGGDPPRAIVGVVGNVRSASGVAGGHALGAPPPQTVYMPASQVPATVARIVHQSFPVTWAVRTSGRSDTVIPSIQEIVRDVAPDLPIIRFGTMDQVIDRSLATQRFLRDLFGAFAAIALALSAIGLYGLIAYAVAQRTREIGIRVALGATARGVLASFLREGVVLAAAGCAIGLAAASALTRLIGQLIFGIEPVDPITFAMVAVILIAVAGIAALVPARRASRVDPMVALRCE